MNKNSKNSLLALIIIATIGLGIEYTLNKNPNFQTTKNKALNALHLYKVINFDENQFQPKISGLRVDKNNESPSLIPLKPENKYEKFSDEELKQMVSRLFITKYSELNEECLPGGIILGVNQVRKGGIFKDYSNYAPEKAKKNLDKILEIYKNAGINPIICDEGEGGFVFGMSDLPSAEEMTEYLLNYAVTEQDELLKEAFRKGRITDRFDKPDESFRYRKNQINLLEKTGLLKGIHESTKTKYIYFLEDPDNEYTMKRALGNKFNLSLPFEEKLKQISELYSTYFKELDNMGVDVIFGPVLDVFKKSSDNFMNQQDRSYHDSFTITRILAKLYIENAHKNNLLVTGKHYLTAGSVKGDIHNVVKPNEDNLIDRRASMETYIKFKKDLDLIMVTHTLHQNKNIPYVISEETIQSLTEIRFPLRYPYEKNNRLFSSETSKSRVNWGINYKGVVITDAINMKGLTNYIENEVKKGNLTKRGEILFGPANSNVEKAAIAAIAAGNDLLIVAHSDLSNIVNAVVEVYKLNDSDFNMKLFDAFEQYNRLQTKLIK